jgi:hypothetical protein
LFTSFLVYLLLHLRVKYKYFSIAHHPILNSSMSQTLCPLHLFFPLFFLSLPQSLQDQAQRSQPQ